MPEHSDALSCVVRRRRARHRFVAREVHAAGPADPRPSRAEDHARWQAERLDAKRRREQHLRELVAAIDVGDAAYRRLCDRLDDFDTRLAAARRTLSATPAARPGAGAPKDGAEAATASRHRPRQPQVMSLRVADGIAV